MGGQCWGSISFGADAIGSFSEKAAPAHAAPVTPRRTGVMILLHITEVRVNIINDSES